MDLLYGIYLIVIDWRIGLAALLDAVLSVFVNTRFKKKIRDLGNEERKAYGEYAGWIYEVITALREIRILGGRNRIEESFERKQKTKTVLRIGVKTGISSLVAKNVITLVNLAITPRMGMPSGEGSGL